MHIIAKLSLVFLTAMLMAPACTHPRNQKHRDRTASLIFTGYAIYVYCVGYISGNYLLPDVQSKRLVLIGQRGIIVCSVAFDIALAAYKLYPNVYPIFHIIIIVYAPFFMLANVAKSGHLLREGTADPFNFGAYCICFVLVAILEFIIVPFWWALFSILFTLFTFLICLDHHLCVKEKFFSVKYSTGLWIYDPDHIKSRMRSSRGYRI